MNKVTRFLAPMVVLICAFGAQAQAPTIYGSMTQNNTWSTWDKEEGVYSFPAAAGMTYTPVHVDYGMSATAGGVLVDNVYHLFNHRGGSTWFSVNYDAYDISDWSTVYSCYFGELIASYDMTADPATDKVYCAHKDGKLLLWNPSNIDEITELGTFSVPILGLACDATGALYGVGSDGGFYSINKANAALTLIGTTGLNPLENQGMVFDHSTGSLYWTAYTTDSKSALYTINPATGTPTKITDFPQNARFMGLYMLTSGTNPSVPATVTDLTANFASGSNSGRISFKMPTTSFGGSELSGALQYRLMDDETQISSGTAYPGQQVFVNTTLSTGNHQLMVIVSNALGDGPKAKLNIYVGKGVPGFVDNPKAQPTATPGQVAISWTAPDYCIPLEAYFDPSELKYSIVRQPDNVTVADHITDCSFVDNITYDGPLKVFTYEITAHIDDLNGQYTRTNGVPVGSPFTPPYEAVMNSVDLDLFTIIDANADGSTWYKDLYDYGVGCGGRWDGENDDWLILPPLYLEGNGVYRTILTVGHDYDGPSRYELKIGRTPTVDGMTQTILGPTSTITSYDGDIRIDESGVYYLGIHCIGSSGSTMYISDITVRGQTNNDAPDAPINLSGVGAEKGELAAYVTFTTPQLSIAGDRLDALTAVNIYHGNTLVKTIEDVEPDTEYTVKVVANQEFNDYSVAAVNEYGEGRRARIEYVFAGYDFPATIPAVTLTENEAGRPHLSWDPTPEVGLYGYYVDPAQVKYEIYRGYGDDTYDLIEDAWNTTEYVDQKLSADLDQFMLTYYIYPVNSIGRGYGTVSNSECYGRPIAAPFVESFPNGQNATSPWYYKTDTPQSAGWIIYRNTDTTVPDIDGSNGMMVFSGEKSGDAATLHAPFVTVKGLSNPILDFYYYKDAMTVVPVVEANGSNLQNRAATDGQKGWQHFEASLAQFACIDRVKLTFKGVATGESYAFIDDIRVRQQLQHDLALTQLIVPASMSLDEDAEVTAVVRNMGSEPSQAATLTLYRNGYSVAEMPVTSLASGAQISISFEQTPDVAFGEKPVYSAVLTYDLDQDNDNNSSVEIASHIKLMQYPAPTDLDADAQLDAVTLTWTAPTATSMAPAPIVEDFESYPAFAIDMEPWTLVDGDKQATSIMSDPLEWYTDLDYPHAGEPMAYQIFDPSAVGIDTAEWIRYAPHSGSKVALCWSTADWQVSNDDWLISPELYPGGQTISFWVYSRVGYFGNEKYEVLYSASTKDVNDFVMLTDGEAYDEWTLVTVNLPADAKYFAIHTVNEMSSAETWYDDITYIPASIPAIQLDLIGYNVYRDNERINSQVLTDTTYVDTKATTGKHKYNVTAVYTVGESVLSDDLMVDTESGIADISADITVIGGNGTITVTGAQGHTLTLHTLTGITVATITPTASPYTFNLPPALYLLTIDNATYKVLVK